MADERGETDPQPTSSMQESWVDVPQQEGKLVHNRSKQELEQLLASAASEEEPDMSDSDTMYKVTFKPSSTTPEQEEDEEEEEEPLTTVQRFTQTSIERLTPETMETPRASESSQSTCSRLLWCVPVLILTHLAIFGIGYYLGKRMSVEPTTLKLLHV